MPTVKELRQNIIAHNNRCKIKGVGRMKKAKLVEVNRKLAYKRKVATKLAGRGGGPRLPVFSKTKKRPKNLK